MKRSLGGLGIKPGTELFFLKDPAVTCVVQDAKRVSFQGQPMSLSRAGSKAVQDMGFTWPSVNGFDYWTLNGKKLSEFPIGGDPMEPDDEF